MFGKFENVVCLKLSCLVGLYDIFIFVIIFGLLKVYGNYDNNYQLRTLFSVLNFLNYVKNLNFLIGTWGLTS